MQQRKDKKASSSTKENTFMVPRYWHNAARGCTMVLVMLLMQLLQQAQGMKSPLHANIRDCQRDVDMYKCVKVYADYCNICCRHTREPAASQETRCRPAPYASIRRGVYESKHISCTSPPCRHLPLLLPVPDLLQFRASPDLPWRAQLPHPTVQCGRQVMQRTLKVVMGRACI